MKNDIVLYERIYRLFKNQIECGIIPAESKLPSRAELCDEFGVSEKTVRRVLDALSKTGLIETRKRMRPVVKNIAPKEDGHGAEALSADTAVPKDIFNTGRLLCYPVIEKGVALCAQEDWKVPSALLARMEPARGTEFWRLSHRFWRYFIARNGNDLIMRAVDSLGFFDWEPLPGSLEQREMYLNGLRNFVQAASQGMQDKAVLLQALSGLYGLGENRYRAAPDSPARTGLYGLEHRLRSAEERYSHVYMDILGLIAIGRYRPGDQLPPHKELQKIYDVSSDTTAKAVHILQEWGVVTAKRGKGVFVSMNLSDLKNVIISPDLIGCHLRRFLDSLELLTLTADGVTAHAAAFISAKEAGGFLQKMDRLWNEEYLYQLTPIALLAFVTEHIQYTALKEIYQVVVQNYHIGRSIPKLVTCDKTPKNRAIHKQGVEALECQIRGDGERFSQKASAMLRYVHELTVRECKRLGYWEIAGKVYDGSALWKKTNFLFRNDA